MTLVRQALPDDLERAVALLAIQLDEHGIEAPQLAATAASVIADSALGRLLVAERDGAIVGVAYVSFTFTLEHGGKVAWLEELYVVPAQREQGIGSAMLAEVLAIAESTGCRAVDLEVDRGHARAAHLYERAGFLPLDRARMSRRLSAPCP